MNTHEFGASLARDDDFAFTVTFGTDGVPALTMDEPPPLGTGRGPNAARLLAAAVGHCLSASLLLCLQKARIDVEDVQTTVRGTMIRNEAGRWRIGGLHVSVVPGIGTVDRSRLDRCLELFEDFCIVTQSVRQGIPVDVSVAPERAKPAGTAV